MVLCLDLVKPAFGPGVGGAVCNTRWHATDTKVLVRHSAEAKNIITTGLASLLVTCSGLPDRVFFGKPTEGINAQQ
jgi:hypothetical protein